MSANRMRVARQVLLILLAGAALALAWWDWTYPGLVPILWRGGQVYRYHGLRLLLGLLLAEAVCLLLWALAGRRLHASRPFALAPLSLLALARYAIHPLGLQPGSSAWTYGLLAVTAAVLVGALGQIALPWRRRAGLATVLLAASLYLILFGSLAVARQNGFRAHALDLGTMDQAAWNTLQGRILERTPLYRDPASGSRYESRLLDAKLELIYLPLSALYGLWADPRLLLVLQAASLAAGAIPLYLLAQERLRAEAPSVLLALAYLLYLPLHYVSMADFHPSALMVAPLIAAWLAMRRRRWGRYYVWLALALCCRIDAALGAVLLGAAIVLLDRSAWRHGLATSLLALGWITTNWTVVVPLVRRSYGPGAGDLVSRRFGALGGTPLDILRTVLTHPWSVLRGLVTRDKVQTVVDLLMPLGFLALLAPLALLPALPVLGINLLAASEWQQSIHAHYMAPVIPYVWIAAVEGIGHLSRTRSARWASLLAGFVLLNTIGISWAFSPYPPGRAYRLADYVQPSSYEQDLRAVIAQIPPGATVCAQSDLHPHLSQRRDAALFPRCQLSPGESAEYVVLDLDPTSVKSPLDHHTFYELVNEWLAREDYGVVALRGAGLLLQRGASRENAPQVAAALAAYGAGLARAGFEGGVDDPVLRRDAYYCVPVILHNQGTQSWHARGQLPVRLSYRWLTEDGAVVHGVSALRTDLPHRVAPGHSAQLRAALLTPAQPGNYILEWDVLREGDTWFSAAGGEPLRQAIAIR
ncbi:MAG: DUF2079 domain-containing protein [Anaerolineae bacterium]|nr:DUF2079 domain-containing protein [Anaerolineae bacterium]